MIWQETNADLARDRQLRLLDEAASHRLLLAAATATTPRYREWLARQLVLLALRLAPSLRCALPGLIERAERPPRLKPFANGSSLALLF